MDCFGCCCSCVSLFGIRISFVKERKVIALALNV